LRKDNGELLLEMHGISKSFPGVQALDNVDFAARRGEVVALIGENGAGKSTLMKILGGVYRYDEGRITLRGEEVVFRSPHHAQELGVSTIYQELNLTTNQTVGENIFLGRQPRLPGILGVLGLVDRQAEWAGALKHLEHLGVPIDPRARVSELSVAKQQLVEVAKALSFDSDILIMDEPTAALPDEEVQRLFDLIRSLKQRGLALIFVSHRLEEVMEIADRIVVLREGQLVGDVPIAEVTVQKIIQMMVGRTITDMYVKDQVEPGEVILEARNLARKGVLSDVSLTVRAGEIVGLGGLIGAGRTETARAIFGADPIDRGQILIYGKPVHIDSPRGAIQHGVGYVPEDRKQQGLILIMAVRENISLARLPVMTDLGWVRSGEVNRLASSMVDQLRIRTPNLQQQVMFLSGGNQQKVVVSKWLALNPKVLILDEPTRGVDVGAKAEIHGLINQLARQGIAILLISSELPELLGMSDRILVMCRGRIAGELQRHEFSQEAVIALASGTEQMNTGEQSVPITNP
jgi:ABC-type sugar transport system ATPase subunit